MGYVLLCLTVPLLWGGFAAWILNRRAQRQSASAQADAPEMYEI